MTIERFPHHIGPNPAKDDRQATAPYNFVPLPEAVLPAEEPPVQDRYDESRFTGFLDLTIQAETPMYVRCGPPANRADPQDPSENPARQDFFHHGDPNRPVVPGSSLRGMTRTLVEILGSGKMQWFNSERLVYRAVADSSSLGNGYRKRMLGDPVNTRNARLQFEYPSYGLRAGFLRRQREGWGIQPAPAPNGDTFVHVEYGTAEAVGFDLFGGSAVSVDLDSGTGRPFSSCRLHRTTTTSAAGTRSHRRRSRPQHRSPQTGRTSSSAIPGSSSRLVPLVDRMNDVSSYAPHRRAQ